MYLHTYISPHRFWRTLANCDVESEGRELRPCTRMAAFADSNYVIPETLGLSMKSAQVAIAVNAFMEENYCDSPVTPVVFEVGPYYT